MIRPVPKLEDGTLALRPWSKRDVEANVVACRDPEVVRWVPRIPSPYDEKDAREFLAHAEKSWKDGTFFGFAVTDREKTRVLGSIGVTVSGATGEVGYFVCAGERRRGIGTRALRLVSRWALEELGIARLQLTTMIGNVASAGLAEKVGFRREGVLRAWLDNRGTRTDVVMYSLLPAEIDRLSGGA